MSDEDDKGRGEQGDSDAAGASSTDIERLKAVKAELALRAEIAASRRALAELGLSGVKAPEGDIKIEGETPIEGVILAYRALDRVAGEIARRVAEAQPKPDRVLLYDEAAFKALSALSALRVHLDLLDREAAALLAGTEPSSGTEVAESFAIPAAGALLTSAVELASLFRKDVTFTYGKVEPAERSFAVAVAGALKARGIAAIDVATVPADPAGRSQGAKGANLRTMLETLQARRQSLAARGWALASARESRAADRTKRTEAETDQDAPAADGPTPEEAAIAATVTALTAFQDALLKVDETTGAVRLAQMLEAETLAALVGPGAAFLWLKLDAAGGGSRTTKSLFSSTVNYSGGAVASFALYDHTGALIDAGTVPRYSGFVTLDPSAPPRSLLPPW